MKRRLALGLALILTLALTACGGQPAGGGGATGSVATGGAAGGATGGVTLDGMKQAAADTGYRISENYLTGDTIVGGFTIEYPNASGSDMIPVVEFKTAADADAFAKTTNDAGYDLCIVNGKFLTTTSVYNGVVQDDTEKAFLENLLSGAPLGPAPTYE